MIPDVDIKTYYLQFVRDANTDVIKYSNDVKDTKILKDSVLKFIKDNVYKYKEYYNIDLEKYTEIVYETYNPDETLYKIVIKYLNVDINNVNRKYIIQLAKYCNLLKREYKSNKKILLAYKRKNMKFGEYRKIVNKYFNTVHKILLDGNGYKFSRGIGTYVINRWKTPDNGKQMIDYDETCKKKKELIEKGLKPYNEAEAKIYESRGVPYPGIRYIVYKDNSHYYEFTFIRSLIFKSNRLLEYDRTEYVHAKYRGWGYKKLSTICNTIDDICKLPVDIKYKLNILLYKHPEKYLNFNRNELQSKY